MLKTMEQIREALQDRNIKVVAQRTGLGMETLYQIARGNRKVIMTSTYDILVRYLFDGGQ